MNQGDMVSACTFLRDGALNYASKDESGTLKTKLDVTTVGFKDVIDPLLTAMGNYRDQQLNGFIAEINS